MGPRSDTNPVWHSEKPLPPAVLKQAKYDAARVRHFGSKTVVLRTGVRDALEKHLPAAVPIAAMYLEDDGSVIVRLCVSDIAFLHQLASVVLTGAPAYMFIAFVMF